MQYSNKFGTQKQQALIINSSIHFGGELNVELSHFQHVPYCPEIHSICPVLNIQPQWIKDVPSARKGAFNSFHKGIRTEEGNSQVINWSNTFNHQQRIKRQRKRRSCEDIWCEMT